MNEIPQKGKKAPKKAKAKEKKVYFEKVKKQVIGAGIVSIVAIAGIVGGFFLSIQFQQSEEDIFIMGYSGGYVDKIDPLNLEDQDPIIISQIVEPLFTEKINHSTNYRENMPLLAKDSDWSVDKLNFTCYLRENIRFHDDTHFNATAVKWNFDRLQRLLLNMSYPSIWYHVDGTQVLNKTVVIDTYIVRFILNRVFAPFQSILSSVQASILSPSSTPEDRFLKAYSEKIVGTGPFKLESNEFLVNTTLIANEFYWGSPKPMIDKLVFLPISYRESNERFFAKETDYAVGNDSYFEAYNADPTITIYEFTEPGIQYLGMNNKRINTTMRKAISYALNYSKILEKHDLYGHGSNIRCRSPLGLGSLYSNWEDFDVPFYNVSKARQVLKDANWLNTSTLLANDNITSGNEWELIANSTTPLATFNISYIVGSEGLLMDLPLIVTKNLNQIGVKVVTLPMTSGSHWGNILSGKTDLWGIGWGGYYNDPAYTINPLFSSKVDGHSNFQQTNDTLIQQWMEEGITETNQALRHEIYYNIQKRLIEEVYPVAWLYSCVWYDIYRSNLKGWGSWGAGAFKYLYFEK